jgi:precorrin-6B methylase 1
MIVVIENFEVGKNVTVIKYGDSCFYDPKLLGYVPFKE